MNLSSGMHRMGIGHRFHDNTRKQKERPKQSDHSFLFLGSMTFIIRSFQEIQNLRMINVIVLILCRSNFMSQYLIAPATCSPVTTASALTFR